MPPPPPPLLLALLLLPLPLAAAPVAFVTIGDWGGAGLSAANKANQLAVARSLALTAAALNTSFVVSTGNNFYECVAGRPFRSAIVYGLE
jgi:hypothetical protein